MSDVIEYERLHTPNPGYVLKRNGVNVGVLMRNRQGWCGTGTHVKVETSGHVRRDEAAAELIELLDAAP